MTHTRDEQAPLLAPSHTIITMPKVAIDTKAILKRLERPSVDALEKLNNDIQYIYYREQSKLLVRWGLPVLGVAGLAMAIFGIVKSCLVSALPANLDVERLYGATSVAGIDANCHGVIYLPYPCNDFNTSVRATLDRMIPSNCWPKMYDICHDNSSAILPADLYCAKPFNYTCDFLLSSLRFCETAANSICQQQASISQQRTEMHDAYLFYFGFGMISLMIAMLVLGGALIVFLPAPSPYHQENELLFPIDSFLKLPKEDQDLLKKDYLALQAQSISLGFRSLESQNITAIRDAIKEEERKIADDKRTINDLRGVTLYASKKHHLPNDIIKRILFFSDLTRTDADKTDQNDKRAIANAKNIPYKEPKMLVHAMK